MPRSCHSCHSTTFGLVYLDIVVIFRSWLTFDLDCAINIMPQPESNAGLKYRGHTVKGGNGMHAAVNLKTTKESSMLRNTSFLVIGTVCLVYVTLASSSSQSAPFNGAFAPTIEADAVQFQCSCIRKSDGRIRCGFMDIYGQLHESKACNPYNSYYSDRYYGVYSPPRPYWYGRGW